MLIAIVVINIGLLAILLSLTSGVTTLRRSAETSTASVVADKQLERYRAVAFTSIYLDTTAVAPAATDSTYETDAAYSASQVNQACGTLTPVCTPTQTVTGPDGRSYRVDTYIVWTTPAGGSAVKQITVVVRKPGSVASARARRVDRRRGLLASSQDALRACRYAIRMAAYAYSAINALGAESAGQITAPDVNAARELLRQKGLRPVSLAEVGARKLGRDEARQAREDARAPGVLAPVRDDDRRGPQRRRLARDSRAADGRQGARRDHQGGPLGRRGRDAPVAGDGAPPAGVRPSLHLDDRGRRGSRHPRHRPRPRRDPDREGDEDPPPRARAR